MNFPRGMLILLDVSFLQKENYLKLQKDLKNRLNDNQKFSVRQVVVKGVLSQGLSKMIKDIF